MTVVKLINNADEKAYPCFTKGLKIPLGILSTGDDSYYSPFMFFPAYICNITFYSYFWVT